MPAAARKTEVVVESDLNDMIRSAIEHNAAVIARLGDDPDNADAVAALHMSGAHLEDVRCAVASYAATIDILTLAVAAGREAAAHEARPRRHSRHARGGSADLRAV